MVDLMMWLVIAAMLLAAAIQGIGYYQQAAYAYQAKNDVTHGHQWAAARVSVESKMPDSEAMQEALTVGDYKISNKPDIALIAAQGQSYCIGVKAYNVNGDNVFYSPSSDPSNITRAKEMPASCGVPGEAAGPEAPGSDSDGDGTTNILDEDIDNDGILNGSDPDVDGDGTLNENDNDIDGDRTPNFKDDTPSGTILGPQYFDALGGPSAIDPRVKIIGGAYSASKSSVDITVEIDNAGLPVNTGPYYGISWRLTCQLPDGTQYYKYGYVWTSYTGASASVRTFNFPCPTTDSSKAIGYIAGTYNGALELKEPTGGTKGPINVISEGTLAPLFGNTFGNAVAVTGYVDPRVSLRNVTLAPTGVVVGVHLDLGGAPFNSNPFYGVSNRLTCKLADGSSFYHYPTLYTSYNGNTYPAPNHAFACPFSTTVGYVSGADNGSVELEARSGQKGATNVLSGGQLNLDGNDASTPAPAGSYMDPRLTIRKFTLSGGADAQIGFNINMANVSSPGASWGYSGRLTCKNNTTGVNSYKIIGMSTSYTGGTFAAPTYTVSCFAGTTAVGYVAGPYLGTPELTYSPGVKGPTNVVKGGTQ